MNRKKDTASPQSYFKKNKCNDCQNFPPKKKIATAYNPTSMKSNLKNRLK
jgi:hypothetical protein